MRRFKYSDQSRYSEQQGVETRTIKYYNASLKGNPVMDDWNIQTSKDP